MNFKGMRYILLAVVVGLIAVFSIHRVVGLKSRTPTEPTASVMVSEAEIASGTVLSPRLVKAVDWPQRIVPALAARSPQQVDGRVTIVPLSKGEPILLNRMAPEGTAAGLGGLLKEEMRAFTLRVDDVSGVAGFLHPGDYVDVLTTMPVAEHRGEQLSKIILQNVKVLTAGQVWEQNAENKPVSVNTVTLEVNPEQSEVLNLASTQGKIRLTLRSRINKEIRPTPGIVTSTLVNGLGHTKSPVVHRQERTVEVIKGLNRTTATLNM
jgi:pilus assembly protein CpaB